MDDVGVSPAAVAKGLIKFNPGYLTTLPGICKIVEFVLLLLAWALCSGFRNGYPYVSNLQSYLTYSSGSIGFFLFVTVTLWILVFIMLIFGLLSLTERLRIPSKLLVFSISYGCAAVLLLISSAIIGGDAATFPGYWCDAISKNKFFSTTCATYKAAVAFGIFSCVAFIFDSVLHFFNHRNQGPSMPV
ncbi:uncharacterized protein LOC135690780 [Rhopilema esculentum]|uniref:uncharacterized protein LOC135690780 n=1 Tax=Rhopilema esculentum TaxID=499914 RepID=UPI0031D68316